MIKKILACTLGLMLSTPAIAEEPAAVGGEWTYRKGLRFGYSYANKAETTERLESPHMFAMGFELQETMSGGEWLDLLFIQNVVVSGLEQSVIIPTVNALVGFEINNVGLT